jgi:hypothetical protein
MLTSSKLTSIPDSTSSFKSSINETEEGTLNIPSTCSANLAWVLRYQMGNYTSTGKGFHTSHHNLWYSIHHKISRIQGIQWPTELYVSHCHRMDEIYTYIIKDYPMER